MMSISGLVTDTDGPLQFATIEVEGRPEYSSITNDSGRYTLELPEGKYQVKVSYVGMIAGRKSIEVSADSVTEVNFNLAPNTQLTEVVVTGTMKASYIADSPVKIDVVKAQQLEAFLPSASASVVDGITLINGVEEVVACGVCFTNSISC